MEGGGSLAGHVHAFLHRVPIPGPAASGWRLFSNRERCGFMALNAAVADEDLPKMQHEINYQAYEFDLLRRCSVFNVQQECGEHTTLVRCCYDAYVHM